ncbi:hypothetical protein J437_LFUL015181 [Ladona fulva]|uniref:DDE Tnp4 domain-containing protein n=1 Tax=Ladona fulva TaxID=123851 RepID=A0A8K0P9F4_LADFU|nr:hypothetical protein J437_LFUL015181 [Ladona fulva]
MMRNAFNEIYWRRNSQGTFKILIQGHLFDDEEKFRQYFRVSHGLFNRILLAIKEDIIKDPCNRVMKPITPTEKLCVTLHIDVGSYGKEGGTGIFSKSKLGKAINNSAFKFPDPMPLLGTEKLLPCVIVSDEAFKLTVNIMRHYSKEQSSTNLQKAVYNYRHSRTRRTSENAFGNFCQYLRIFHVPITVKLETVDDLTMAACILQNLLISDHISYSREPVEDELYLPKENVQPLAKLGGNATHEAFKIQDDFTE